MNIPLTKIRFWEMTRPVGEAHVKNLVEVYKQTGCNPRENPIPGCVTRAQLEMISEELDELQDHDIGIGTYIFEEVTCFHGLHRVEAAKRLLAPAEQWWTVDLYLTEELTPEDCRKLTQQTDITVPYEDGIILRHILLYQSEGNVEGEAHWWSQTSYVNRRDIKALLKLDLIKEKLCRLVGFPGLWHGIKIGALHSVSVHELLPVSKSYSSMYAFWARINNYTRK